MRVRRLVNLDFVKISRISHLPLAVGMRDTMLDVLTDCWIHRSINSYLWHIKYKWFLARVSANWTSVECICCVICSFVPIQKRSWRHFHLTGWKDSSKNLNSKSPRNRNGPTLWLVIADGLLHDSCWVQLHWYKKPLKGLNAGRVGEDGLNHIKVMHCH